MSSRFITNIDKQILEVLSEITEDHDQDLIGLSIDAIYSIDLALGCRFQTMRDKYLLHCIVILAAERINNRAEIEQLKGEVEALQKEVYESREIISTYNGSYLQRAKVKNGLKIAKKGAVTKEAIQRLQGQNLTIEQIAKELGCSRSTIWRRLKE